MEGKRTLFDYLYRNLKEQILTGYLGYGELLPSLNGLCEIYNVGIRTAKDVIRALKEEGLIQTEERKPSHVIYRRPQCSPDIHVIQSVLKKGHPYSRSTRPWSYCFPPSFPFHWRYAAAIYRGCVLHSCARTAGRTFGPGGNQHPFHCIIYWMRPATCCSGTYLPTWNCAPGFHFSWSSGSHRHFLLPPWLIKIQCGCWRQPIAAI